MSSILRTSNQLLLAAATDATAAIRQAGLHAETGSGPGRVDVDIDDRRTSFSVVAVAYATEPRVQPLLGTPAPDGLLPILVADRITAGARAALAQRGWSYLDRRGHLRLRGAGVLVDVPVDPIGLLLAGSRSDPLPGKAGMAVAYQLLSAPQEQLTPTRSGTGFAPSTISAALQRMREGGLVDAGNRPILPELFWALVERWHPRRHWLLESPDPREAGSDREAPGWCLSGTSAAVELGAPIVARRPQLDLYVPGPAAATIALRRHGSAPDAGTAAASIAVAPVLAVTTNRGRRSATGWPLAHPVAVALDLAQDRARGREVLQDWSPAERVW